MRWIKHMACMGGKEKAFRVWVRKFERLRPLGRLGLDGKKILL
jgi:hypothetical protein